MRAKKGQRPVDTSRTPTVVPPQYHDELRDILGELAVMQRGFIALQHRIVQVIEGSS